MKRRRRRRPVAEPVPPENVRLRRGDGTVIPLECRYDGVDPRGLHLWVAVCPIALDPDEAVEMQADMLPGDTAIRVEVVER